MEMEIEVEKCSVQKVLEHLIKVAEISDFEVHSIPMDKEVEVDDEPFEEKMERLTTTLAKQFKKSRELEEEIRKQLKGIVFEL
jgi:hypothetical protein